MCNLFSVHYISIIHFQKKRNKLDTLSLILSWKAWNYVKSLFSYVTYKINITMGVIDVQAGFEKAEEQEIWWPTSTGLLKKQESSRKTSITALLMMPKPLPVWITINCGKFWKKWEYQTTWPAFWEICMQIRNQQLELAWKNRLITNRKRSTSKLYIVTLLI